MESAVLRELVAVADGPGRGMLLFPEICTMELQLLATGSPDLEVLSHVFHSLLDAVHANPRNAALLYDQVRLTTELSPQSKSVVVFSTVAVRKTTNTFSGPLREESKPFCLASTTSSAKQTPPLQVCYSSFLIFSSSDTVGYCSCVTSREKKWERSVCCVP